MMTLEEMEAQRRRIQDNQVVMPMWECAMRLDLMLTRLSENPRRVTEPAPGGAEVNGTSEAGAAVREFFARPRQAGLGSMAPLLPCVVRKPPWTVARALDGRCVPEVHGWACVDTGTRVSCLDVAVMELLGIEPVGTRNMWGISSTQRLEAPVFAATVMFPGSIGEVTLADFVGVHLEWAMAPESRESRDRPVIVLLGRASLSNFTLVYNGPESSITLIRRQ